MFSSMRTVVLVVALVVMVGVITYVVHNVSNPVETGIPDFGRHSKSPPKTLTFPVKTVEWAPGEGGEFELHTPGHHLFLFRNAEQGPVLTGLAEKNCVCSQVEMCALTEAETRRFHAHSACTHLLTAASRQPVLGAHPAGWAGHLWDAHLLEWSAGHQWDAKKEQWTAKAVSPWQSLVEQKGELVKVSQGCVGLIRVTWKGDKENPIRLTADLLHQDAERAGAARAHNRLEVALAFVPTIRLHPPFVENLNLTPRDTAEREFICWSSTRSKFSLEPSKDSQHPCFEITMTPLTDEERAKWKPLLKSRILSGYRVKLKIHERRTDREQLDIGLLRRKLEFVSDATTSPLVVLLAGNVRGEITLEGSTDKDRLALETFPARSGVKKQFFLQGENSTIDLLPEITIEPPELRYLSVQLDKDAEASRGGRTVWSLTVAVPGGNPSGRLPRDSAIILKIKGDPPRRVRIPVTGTATN